jgi:hypothetical protein
MPSAALGAANLATVRCRRGRDTGRRRMRQQPDHEVIGGIDDHGSIDEHRHNDHTDRDANDHNDGNDGNNANNANNANGKKSSDGFARNLAQNGCSRHRPTPDGNREQQLGADTVGG